MQHVQFNAINVHFNDWHKFFLNSLRNNKIIFLKLCLTFNVTLHTRSSDTSGCSFNNSTNGVKLSDQSTCRGATQICVLSRASIFAPLLCKPSRYEPNANPFFCQFVYFLRTSILKWLSTNIVECHKVYYQSRTYLRFSSSSVSETPRGFQASSNSFIF